MRTTPVLLLVLAACGAGGNAEQPKSAGAPAAGADSAATAGGKPSDKPGTGQTAAAPSGDGFGVSPSQAGGVQPGSGAGAAPADGDLPEIRRLDPAEVEAEERQAGLREIRPVSEGKPER